MGVLTRLRMVNWAAWMILVIPVAYIAFYLWALRYGIIPWLSIPIAEFHTLTLLQIVATMIFLTGGVLMFIVCLIIVLGMVLG